MNKDICPSCKADLQGEPLTMQQLEAGYYGEGVTHFSRLIGIYDRAQDRTVEWLCPECGHRWQAWQ